MIDSSSISLTPTLPMGILSPGSSLAGATDSEKMKAACKAIEGVFTSQLMSEIGKGLDDSDKSQQSGMYQDFIQQALAQGISNGGGFGLAKMLETSLTPAAKAHLPATQTSSTHAPGND
jgi:Rod binding domain-containing protein